MIATRDSPRPFCTRVRDGPHRQPRTPSLSPDTRAPTPSHRDPASSFTTKKSDL